MLYLAPVMGEEKQTRMLHVVRYLTCDVLRHSVSEQMNYTCSEKGTSCVMRDAFNKLTFALLCFALLMKPRSRKI